MRRIILVLAVAAVMAAMMVAMAMPAFAGNSFAKGKGNEVFSTNPGESVNDLHGDNNNNVANPECNPLSTQKANNPNGGGCSNN